MGRLKMNVHTRKRDTSFAATEKENSLTSLTPNVIEVWPFQYLKGEMVLTIN